MGAQCRFSFFTQSRLSPFHCFVRGSTKLLHQISDPLLRSHFWHYFSNFLFHGATDRCARGAPATMSLRVPLRCWNEGNNTLSHPRRADVRRRHVFPPWSNASCRYQFFALLRFALFSLLFAEKVEATVRLTRRGLLFVFLCGRTCVACVVYVSYFSDRTPLPSTPAAARRPSQC